MSLIVNIPNNTGSSKEISQQVGQYNDLVDGSEIGELSYVENSQGTSWLPGTLGGTYFPKGWYRWDGTNWVSDRNAITNQLEQTIIQVDNQINRLDNLEIDNRVIIKQASDFPVPVDSTKVYVPDGKIDMGTTSIVIGSGGFFVDGLDYFISGFYSTADNYTMFVNQTGQPSGNVRIRNMELYTIGTNSQVFDLDNQGSFGSIELLSTNVGYFGGLTTSIGNLSNYRQFRTDDAAFIRCADGLTFNGTWAGGFAVTSTILLSIGDNISLFKEGTSLSFQGSSISDLNAISVGDNVTVFEFQESNFERDEGFKLNSARFKIDTNPVPNIGFSTTKKLFKDCSGLKNTFPGGRWEVTTQSETILSGQNQFKAAGTTTYDDLVHFSQTTNNAFVYESEINKDFIVTGQLVVDGGANDEIDVIVRKWDNSVSAYEDIRVFTRNISNVLGGLDIAYFDPYAPVSLDKDDRIEVWLRNNTDNTNATLLEGSFLAINIRN